MAFHIKGWKKKKKLGIIRAIAKDTLIVESKTSHAEGILSNFSTACNLYKSLSGWKKRAAHPKPLYKERALWKRYQSKNRSESSDRSDRAYPKDVSLFFLPSRHVF
jgi:hypothetical protein